MLLRDGVSLKTQRRPPSTANPSRARRHTHSPETHLRRITPRRKKRSVHCSPRHAHHSLSPSADGQPSPPVTSTSVCIEPKKK
ncbi:hypothetical protein OG21DRAFT_296857 [Imleria badia]|nr:hypothetical protein OG21DRAFT_296857 [Imleria badia]